MSDHNDTPALHDSLEGDLDLVLGLGVQGGGGLVQQQQTRLLDDGPGGRWGQGAGSEQADVQKTRRYADISGGGFVPRRRVCSLKTIYKSY